MNRSEVDKILSITHISSSDDLEDLLGSLRDEFIETGEFSSKEIARIPDRFFEIVSPKINRFSQIIQDITDWEACLTRSCRFDPDEEEYFQVIYLVWKGDW